MSRARSWLSWAVAAYNNARRHVTISAARLCLSVIHPIISPYLLVSTEVDLCLKWARVQVQFTLGLEQ